MLTKSEQNYPIYQVKQLAVIEGYRDNFFVANGNPVTIFCNIKILYSVANATPRIKNVRKMQTLGNYTGAKVSFRKGNEHQLADFLSRFRAPIIAEI